MKTRRVKGVPTWASNYLMYGDAGDLTEEDIEQCDKFVEDLDRRGLRLLAPDEDSHDEFDPCPAFGLACATEDWIAEVVEDKSTKGR